MTSSITSKPSGNQMAFSVAGTETFSFDDTGYDSPFTVSASVASNAINVTLKAGGWRFRNTTLTNGVPSYVKSNTDLTLTIAASDSFGAVTAGGNLRIAIVVVNNAGVLQLAALNVAGGVQNDETNLITTATTATTATSIKSNSVVSNVAYRLAGYVTVPFTTGTGYGAIVQTQSCVGVSLAGFSGLGYGQTWQNLTGSRAFGTTYYNTTGRPIVVSVITNSSNTSTSISITVSGIGIAQNGNYNAGGGIPNSASAIVPPAASYTVNSGSGISVWAELR